MTRALTSKRCYNMENGDFSIFLYISDFFKDNLPTIVVLGTDE